MTDPLVHIGKLDLGQGHIFEVVLANDEQHIVGWLHTHPDARKLDADLCQSFCAIRPITGCDVHTVVSADPLTLEPSLKCGMCGSHGYVRDNKWEPC